MEKRFYTKITLISGLGFIVGIFSVIFFQNCSPLDQVKKLDNERFEEIKKIHVSDTIIAQKVSSILSSNLKGKEVLDSTALRSIIDATVHYHTLADSILYQTKIYLLEKDVDDIRQETNNVINKYNGLLSLWIAIITVIGGIVPWIVFFRIEDRNTQRTAEMETTFQQNKESVQQAVKAYQRMRNMAMSHLNTTKKELSAETKEIMAKLKTETDEIRKDIAKSRNQYILETDKNKIINVVFGITSCANPSICKYHTNREELSRLFLRDLALNLKLFIDHLKRINEEEPDSDFWKEAILVLFQIEFGIIKSQTVFTKNHLNRELATLQDTLKNSINDLMHQSLSAIEIFDRLENVLTKLYTFEHKI